MKGSGAGLRFECTRCGRCCTNRGDYAYVYVSEDETRTLAEFLGLSTGAFKRRHTLVDEYGWRQLRFKGDHCRFLDTGTGLCRVHAARPAQCRTFPFWREFVRDGEWSAAVSELCEGIGRGEACDPEEAEAQMLEMEASEEA